MESRPARRAPDQNRQRQPNISVSCVAALASPPPISDSPTDLSKCVPARGLVERALALSPRLNGLVTLN
ncbi:hypothetical protein TWF106_000241 [Orbilia oligospora]|uniref:Uncharacterized protein n=1 Tax=Orbilia oligospora TaxID=2813651 RepID=A0A7C8V2Q3_ORBOL|nr:hypothetical protein TWF679_001933 [Orbilia oligospora]KAF3226499.1 hypothetical protein TWF106_000241 [Orbilia oligospora]